MPDQVQSQTISLPVLGMTCAGCASSVQSVLRAQQGVQSADVNYATQQVKVTFSPQLASPQQFKTALQAVGYDVITETLNARAKQEEIQGENYTSLRNKTVIAAVLTLPVVIIGMFFMDMPYASYVMLALTTPVLFILGKQFFIHAFLQARHQRANMDTLVALSTGISYLFSIFNTFYPEYLHSRGIHPHVYYEAAAVVIVFVMLGKVLEEKAKSNTSSAIRKLMGLQPKTVTVMLQGKPEQRPVDEVVPGNLLLVKPGEKIPVDGKVTSGHSYVDESMISGEPVAVLKQQDSLVYAGTLNQKGSFEFQAQKVGAETLLAHIIQLVQDAQGSKAPVQKLVDKIAAVFVPSVLFIALCTLGAWLLFGGAFKVSQGLMAMVTVLVIACPCALGLATPTAIMVGIGKGAEQGILIKDAEALEAGYKVNTVLLDKTGTLTEGHPAVTGIHWSPSVRGSEASLAGIFLAMEQQSEHPLAGAVVQHLCALGTVPAGITGFGSLTGIGVRGTLDGKVYLAGSHKLLLQEGLVLPAELESVVKGYQEQSNTIIYFSDTQEVFAVAGVADQLKPGSQQAVQELQESGIEVYMLTGDNQFTARSVAAQAGIRQYKYDMLPSAKADFVKHLQQQGRIVAMVGDGINDSQALAQADLSVAMGKGSDIAMDVAKITLISADLRQVSRAIRLSQATVRTIRQNLFWAFIYNLIGIPVAAGILYPWNGFLLNPMIAGAAMALSSVSVVGNSLRLKLAKR